MRPSESNNSKTQEHDDMHLWLQDVENQRKIIDHILAGCSEDISEELDDAVKRVGKKIIRVARLSIHEVKNVSSDYNVKSLEIEKPMYSGYYLRGICDAIMTWNFQIVYHISGQKLIHNPTGNGKIRCNGRDSACYLCEKCTSCHVHQGTYDIDETIKPTIEIHPDKIHELSGHVLIELKPKLNSVSGVIGQIKTYRDLFERTYVKKEYGLLCCAVITYDTNTKYDQILKAENIHLIRIERNESIKVDDR
ncbi:MAG: hypothetical protein CV087_22985 [Candidatus Brocadia sp. WS118]|nr:MAG: hypothetical protein CV087_22985 [Candidatus Brocadia sp. WS118]